MDLVDLVDYGFLISPISTFGLEGLTQRMGATRSYSAYGRHPVLLSVWAPPGLTQHMGGTRSCSAYGRHTVIMVFDFAHKHVRPGRPHSAYGRHPAAYGRHPVLLSVWAALGLAQRMGATRSYSAYGRYPAIQVFVYRKWFNSARLYSVSGPSCL